MSRVQPRPPTVLEPELWSAQGADGRSSGAVELRPATGRAQWEELLSRLPGATTFHSWEWLEWIAPLVECRFEAMVAYDGAALPVGVIPLLLKRRGPVATANWVPFPYLGPLVPEELLPGTLDALRAEARRARVVNLQIVAHPLAPLSYNRLTTYGEHGFSAHLEETYLIQLHGRELDEIRKAMSRSTKQKLHGLIDRQEIELRPSSAHEIEHLLPRVQAAALERQGLRTPYRSDLGRTLAQHPPAVPLRIMSAVADGNTVAILATVGGQIALGWLGGPLERSKGAGPTIALYWDAIAWAHGIGSEYLDLVGIPNPGIAAFKRQFGGTLFSYVVAGRTASAYRLLAAARAAVPHRKAATTS